MIVPLPKPKVSQAGRRTRMPFRHKLMLVLACEIVLVGFNQAGRNPHHVGILIEVPDQAHHVVT